MAGTFMALIDSRPSLDRVSFQPPVVQFAHAMDRLDRLANEPMASYVWTGNARCDICKTLGILSGYHKFNPVDPLKSVDVCMECATHLRDTVFKDLAIAKQLFVEFVEFERASRREARSLSASEYERASHREAGSLSASEYEQASHREAGSLSASEYEQASRREAGSLSASEYENLGEMKACVPNPESSVNETEPSKQSNIPLVHLELAQSMLQDEQVFLRHLGNQSVSDHQRNRVRERIVEQHFYEGFRLGAWKSNAEGMAFFKRAIFPAKNT